MDSKEFFQHHQKSWVGKQGIYVIENELFSQKLGRPVFKIGMARNSLAVRIGDYKTAYGLIPFKIHLIYEVPESLGGNRANFARLTESIIKATLEKMGKWSTEGEWFYDLNTIMNVISSVRKNHLETIKSAVKWKYYTTKISTEIVPIVEEKDIKSSLKGLIRMTDEEKQERFGRGQKKVKYPK